MCLAELSIGIKMDAAGIGISVLGSVRYRWSLISLALPSYGFWQRCGTGTGTVGTVTF
jgi:hypothetical protein